MTLANDLKFIQGTLAKGDYTKSLRSLEELANKYPLVSQEGGKIRILMVTALMGLGEEQKAISICQRLLKNNNLAINQEAKNLLSILKAPSLTRPRNWSLEIPNLAMSSSEVSYSVNKKPRNKKKIPKAPATGPTKDLNIGFTIISIVIFLALTILLSGCVRISSGITITGLNRLEMSWEIQSNSNTLLSWQSQFQNTFRVLEPKVQFETNKNGNQKITSPSLSSEEADLLLKHAYYAAAESAGLKLPKPNITLEEKNWIIGVNQVLGLTIDLRDLPELPGVSLSVLVNTGSNKKEVMSVPIHATKNDSEIIWQLQQNSLNNLKVKMWRWNQLGLGVIIVFVVLTFSILLQNIRLQMGLGFPELPP